MAQRVSVEGWNAKGFDVALEHVLDGERLRPLRALLSPVALLELPDDYPYHLVQHSGLAHLIEEPVYVPGRRFYVLEEEDLAREVWLPGRPYRLAQEPQATSHHGSADRAAPERPDVLVLRVGRHLSERPLRGECSQQPLLGERLGLPVVDAGEAWTV